ncbi:MAG: UDP-N-acetylmuramate dehydrogenase [Prevotella sp.]
MKDIADYNLLGHNTFGIDVKCRRYLEFASVGELRMLLSEYDIRHEHFRVIGAGSNLLFLNDFDGYILHSAIMGCDVVQDKDDDIVRLRCGSGETWDDVVRMCVDNGWYGAENLSLIPGEAGASAVQNIGAYGVEAKDIILEVEAVDLTDGRLVTFSNAECEYEYRNSVFKHKYKNRFVITHVTYGLSRSFRPSLEYGNIKQALGDKINNLTARQLREAIVQIRQAKLPDTKVLGNAGSFFKNPVVTQQHFERLLKIYPDMPHYAVPTGVKIPAGWLIEKCGWKGKTIGKVGVHAKQALILINLGGASGREILDLCNRICDDVRARFDIRIEPEVNIID